MVEREAADFFPNDCQEATNCVQGSDACGIPTLGCVTESVIENPGPCGPMSCADAHTGCFRTSQFPAVVKADGGVALTLRDLAAMHRDLRAKALER
ncbi:MAG TPA: hypothetical protein VFX35_00155 [Solirubrobacterales bacterium]|nr:hypothetical protein [Solirubrobacterales bacterium]